MSSAGAAAETSVRDDLLTAMSELRARDKAAEGEGTPAPETPPADDGAAPPANDAGRARDEHGRFAKKDAAPEGEAPVEGAAPAAPATPAVKAPDGWTAEMKSLFGTLDPKVQAEISRRETELTRKITSVDDDRAFGKKLKEIAQPYAATMRAEETSIDQAFSQFLNTAYILRQGTPQQKFQALMSVAQRYGVPLNQQFQQPQGEPALHPAIETLQQRLDRIERENQAKENALLQSEIDAFAAAPGHEHYETVKPLMGALLSNGQAKDLQDAYDQAIWATPDIRSTLIATQTAQAQQKQIQKAVQAKQAAGSVTGGPGSARPPQAAPSSAGSVRDDIKAAIASLNEGRI